MGNIYARAGDVGFANGRGLLAHAIRYVEREDGEPKTFANHTLLFTKDGAVGPPAGAPVVGPPSVLQAEAVEALWPRVVNGRWWDRHSKEKGYRVRVYRPTFLGAEAGLVVANALEHVGERYGFWKLGFHLADRVLFGGEKHISKLLRVDSRPICSYLVADAFAEVGFPWAFGREVKPEAQDPDNQCDFVDRNSYGDNPLWRYIGEVVV